MERYKEDMSPSCVYIPSNDVLFKMMKATIGSKVIKDLWIYNPGYSSHIKEIEEIQL